MKEKLCLIRTNPAEALRKQGKKLISPAKISSNKIQTYRP